MYQYSYQKIRRAKNIIDVLKAINKRAKFMRQTLTKHLHGKLRKLTGGDYGDFIGINIKF